MATQTQMQEGVEHEQPRQRRRAKERPDALVNQLSKLFATDSPAQQNATEIDRDKEPNPTLQETAKAFARIDKAIWGYLAEAYRKLDHKEFDPQTLAQFYEHSAKSDWISVIELRARAFNRVCITGAKHPKQILKRNLDEIEMSIWAEVAAIFSQSMHSMHHTRYYNSPQSGPQNIARNLVDSLCTDNNRCSVFIADLLPRLVELDQCDLEMQAVLRNRWTYIDLILDSWFQDERQSRCDVPRWHEISQLFKPSTAKEEDRLSVRLNEVSSALWLSLLVFLITIPTTALGWQYSPHQPGTTRDADFWFLIQSSCMTILGFAVLAIPIWRTEAFSVKARFWVWGLLIAASLCMALAPVVYIFGPNEWSQCMSIVSGIFQVFLTLQVALVADSAGKGGSKSGKKDK